MEFYVNVVHKGTVKMLHLAPKCQLKV